MNSSDKIEQYLLLAKGLRGLALSDLIQKATAEPGLYTFGELLALPQVQQVSQIRCTSVLQFFVRPPPPHLFW